MNISGLVEKVRKAKKVLIIGNGGSFANAEHIANDLLSCGIKAFSINTAFFSATANDQGYNHSFSRWVGVVGEPGDLLIAMSGSGKSPNILQAVETARSLGMDVEKIFGAPAMDMQSSEEAQVFIGHELMRALR